MLWFSVEHEYSTFFRQYKGKNTYRAIADEQIREPQVIRVESLVEGVSRLWELD